MKLLSAFDTSTQLAIDTKGIDNLRLQARQNEDEGLKQTAKQFESLMVNMMLRSMRSATPKNGIFDSEQSQFYTQMLDQQLSQNLSSQGIGLAEMLVQQLKKDSSGNLIDHPISEAESILSSIESSAGKNGLISLAPSEPKDLPNSLWTTPKQETNRPISMFQSYQSTVMPLEVNKTNASKSMQSLQGKPNDFVNLVQPYARAIAKETGIPEQFMIAQAALETGWGKHQIRLSENQPSYNLFGIKAGKNWKGPVAEAVTTEYINGVAQKVVDKFRVYRSYEESFRDYANLLLTNSRYSGVLKTQSAVAFAWGLQQAGYATDPYYAQKLIKILNSEVFQINKIPS